MAASRAVGRLVDDLRDDRPARAADLAAVVPAAARTRRRPTSSRRRRSGTWISGPRSRRRSSRIASSPGRITASAFARPDARRLRRDRHDASGADSCVRRARRASRRRAVQAAVRNRRHHAAVRRARAGEGARARRSREGIRRRDDLHVRRRHRRGLVARARAAGPRGHPAERRASAGRHGASAGWESDDAARAQQHYDQLAGLSAVKARARIVELLRETRRSRRRAAADHARGEVLREGRPAARDRHEPPVVHQDDGVPRAAARSAARELQWHPPYMQARLENWINGLAGDWCVSRQRFFGVPFPVWYRVRGGRDGRPRRAAAARRGSRLPIDPSTDVPGRLYAGAARTSRAGLPAIRTSWTPGRRRRSRRRSPARWEEDPDLFARVFPMDVRPQAHDIIRTWLFSTRCCGRSSSTARCRGATPRSPAGCSIRTARRCRSRRGTSSRRWGCSRSTAPTASATGRRAGGRAPTPRSTPGRCKVGRRLAIKLLNASKFVLSKPEPHGPVTAPIDRGLLTRLATIVRRIDGRPRGLQLHPRARTDRNVLLVLLRRLPRAGEGTPLRRPGAGAGRRRRTGRC